MSKLTISPIEEELDAICIKHYEETKGMTPRERTMYIKAKIAPIMEPYNFRVQPQWSFLALHSR